MLSFREVTFLFFFNIFSFDCFAIDYFISQSAGNDDNSGISPAAAIKSLTRVNNLSLSPGDALYFHKGNTWYGYLKPLGSGNQNLPIRIDSYGEGDAPIINGFGFHAAILIHNEDNYHISNLKLINEDTHLDQNDKVKKIEGLFLDGSLERYGLKVVADSRSLNNFKFENISIQNIFPTEGHMGYGIKFESTSDRSLENYFVISNVDMNQLEINNTGHYGIWIKPLGLYGITDNYKHYKYTLKNSKIHNTGGAGISIVKVNDVLIENNHFDGTGSSSDHRMYA